MQHLERSSATSAELCTELSEYNTHGLRAWHFYQQTRPTKNINSMHLKKKKKKKRVNMKNDEKKE